MTTNINNKEDILMTEYDKIIEQLSKEGRVRVYTDQENLEISKRLSTGLNEFLLKYTEPIIK